MKTLYVIHHSHTDIGYTHLQHKITTWHIDFIRQAMQIIEARIAKGIQKKNPFIWTCETFWAIEKFYEAASEIEKERFIKYVKDGYISISGNYLNFNELISDEILDKLFKRKTLFEVQNSIKIESAMTADINGFSWGYSQKLFDSGVQNLFTCVHTHHGMFPLFRKQVPFFWETPKGNKILVWNGEHYHLGNELGLAPDANSSYSIKDECDAETIFSDNWKIAELRIPRYFKALEENGYPFDFAPVMVSGLRTDNSPPSEKIVEMVVKWNKKHGDKFLIKMCTLEQFFEIVNSNSEQISTFKGDWPDWWSDGFASAPKSSAIYKKGVRTYQKSLLLEATKESKIYNENKIVDLGALYAEHTFSHSESVRSPWNYLAREISARKKSYAIEFLEAAEIAHDKQLYDLGMCTLNPITALTYKVINPYKNKITANVRFEVGHYEFNEKRLDKGFKVVCNDIEIDSHLEHTANGGDIVSTITLEPLQDVIVQIVPITTKFQNMISPVSLKGSDGVDDVTTNIGELNYSLKSKFYSIDFSHAGIKSIFDKSNNSELISSEKDHDLFSILYDISYSKDKNYPTNVRGGMGRNRKSEDVQHFEGILKRISNKSFNSIYNSCSLEFESEGFKKFEICLKNYHSHPLIEAKIICHKKSVWESENVYISLPFASGNDKIVLDKIVNDVVPQKDQLPGTCTDFYTIQNGFSVKKDDIEIIVAMKDSSIVQLGAVYYQRRLLNHENTPKNFKIYNWLMSNYWETNFEAEMGGFYEFNFSITSSKVSKNHREKLRNMSLDIECFRMK